MEHLLTEEDAEDYGDKHGPYEAQILHRKLSERYWKDLKEDFGIDRYKAWNISVLLRESRTDILIENDRGRWYACTYHSYRAFWGPIHFVSKTSFRCVSFYYSIEGFPCIGRGFEAIDKLLGNETAHKQNGNASVARTQYDTQLAKTRRKKEMLEESKRLRKESQLKRQNSALAAERLRMNQ